MDFEQIRDNLMNAATQLLSLRVIVTSPSEKAADLPALYVLLAALLAPGACAQWEVDSVSGDVELLCTVAPTRKVDINTMSANVRLALPGEIRGFAAEMSAALGGSITNEFGPNRYGTCALPIHMDTMSGKLMITRLY